MLILVLLALLVVASADGTRLGVVRGGATYVLDGEGKLVAGALPRTAVVSAAQISPDGSPARRRVCQGS